VVKNRLKNFAENCGLSNRMRLRSILIYELLESVFPELKENKQSEFKNILKSILPSNGRKPDNKTIAKSISGWSNIDSFRIMKFIGTYFHLLNQAEQSEIISINSSRSNLATYSTPKADSIFAGINYLKQKEIDFDKAKAIINKISIHPTFTAHPTESRRPSSISKQKKIIKKIDQILFSKIGEKEKSILKNEAMRLCSLLVLTDDIRSHKISIEDEINNNINNTLDTLWDAIPRLAYDISSAFEIYYNKEVNNSNFIKFHNWVGGDRDGNPSVNHVITRRAINTQKLRIAEKFISALEVLYDELSISINDNDKVFKLKNSILVDRQVLPIKSKFDQKLKYEPFRLKIYCIILKLRLYKKDIKNNEKALSYCSAQFISDLKLIKSSLKLISGDTNIDRGLINDLVIRAEIFGFIMMSIDIRQHSGIHELVVNEILMKKNLNSNYSVMSETEKNRVLVEGIKSYSRLDQAFIQSLSTICRETLLTFKVIEEELRKDNDVISSYIVSMTHSKSDLLEVLFLSKLSGVLKYQSGKITCPLHIVPLYETIKDLSSAPEKLNELLEDETYRSYLKSQGDFQEIMLGYSDSNKDGGMGMAQFSLNECQGRLARICKENQIDLRLFHGRGGSISRGGGKSNKAIISLPPICHNGKIRMTEQGEVISYRYGSSKIAKRHLEQLINAQIISLAGISKNVTDDGSELNKKIASKSYIAYKNNILNRKCWNYFIRVTPIHHISNIPIGSRPASRKNVSSGEVGFDDLRAIPWVFSWTQLRYNLTGWYGLGTALSHLIYKSSSLKELKDLYKNSKFFRQLLDNMSFEMARSRLQISKLYSKTKTELEFHTKLRQEYNLCFESYKLITGYENLLDRNAVISNSIAFRNPFTDLLNIIQIKLLKQVRSNKGPINKDLERSIFMSINAIAAAMQTTG
tara:strand:- start:837 stop:3602 length:2766 start_codon:yes stop_codon:yes gene_type:complete